VTDFFIASSSFLILAKRTVNRSCISSSHSCHRGIKSSLILSMISAFQLAVPTAFVVCFPSCLQNALYEAKIVKSISRAELGSKCWENVYHYATMLDQYRPGSESNVTYFSPFICFAYGCVFPCADPRRFWNVRKMVSMIKIQLTEETHDLSLEFGSKSGMCFTYHVVRLTKRELASWTNPES
jgi:hypothetical protein